MKHKKNDVDKVTIKQEKGTWKRFIKLLGKSHIPFVFVIIYLVMDIALVNVGISETDYTAQLFAGDTSPALIAKLVGVIIINMICANATTFMRQLTTARTDRNARYSVWSKMMKIPMRFFKDSNPQDAITRVVNNASAVGTTIIMVIIPLITSAYGIIACLLKLFTYDYRLSLIIIAFFPISILIAFITGRLKYSVTKSGTNIIALLTEQLSELVMNIPLAKAFAKEKYEQKRGNDIVDRFYRVNIKAGWIDKVGELAFSVSDVIQTVIIVLMGVLLTKNGEITKRAWIAFFMFSSVVVSYVENLIMYWHNSKNIQGIIDRAAHIMDFENEDSGSINADNMKGDISINNISFSYDDSRTVLNDFSCKFEEGKTTALLGESGCGKTTIVNLIDQIYRLDDGNITVGETDIYDYELDSYRKQFAVVSQNIMLFSGSIRENICLGLNDIDDEKINSALEQVGMLDFVNAFENGLDSEIGEQGDRLSGGQKQKLALARMILSKANYIILDEATASLDTVAVDEIKIILEKLIKGKTVIIIAHSPHLLSLADNAVVIESGKLSAQGSIDTVAADNAFCKSLLKGADFNG